MQPSQVFPSDPIRIEYAIDTPNNWIVKGIAITVFGKDWRQDIYVNGRGEVQSDFPFSHACLVGEGISREGIGQQMFVDMNRIPATHQNTLHLHILKADTGFMKEYRFIGKSYDPPGLFECFDSKPVYLGYCDLPGTWFNFNGVEPLWNKKADLKVKLTGILWETLLLCRSGHVVRQISEGVGVNKITQIQLKEIGDKNIFRSRKQDGSWEDFRFQNRAYLDEWLD